jgi:hypothetical protein
MPPWKPEIRVVGTYKVSVDTELIAEINALDLRKQEFETQRSPIGYKPQPDERRGPSFYEHLISVVLIELTLSDTDPRYSADDFGQRDSEQAAYMLKYLSEDGETVVPVDEYAHPPEGSIRLAFFLHFFDHTKPLRTSYGEVQVPAPIDMPERLRRIFRYKP